VMNYERITNVCAQMQELFARYKTHPRRWDRRRSAMEESRVQHCIEMCDAVPAFAADGRREKAMRWLGFLQGAAWTLHLATIEELKEMNKP